MEFLCGRYCIDSCTCRYPDSVLVRENMKAYVSKSDDIETIQEKSRTIAVGEVMIFVLVCLCHQTPLDNICFPEEDEPIIQLTRCSFLWGRCWEFEARRRLGSSDASTRFLKPKTIS